MSNNPALNTLLKAEEQAVGLQIKLQHLESLLYFLGEFFERETLDPNSPDEPTRTASYSLLKQYREYQSIYEIAIDAVHTLDSSAGTLADVISAAFSETKKSIA